MSRKTETENCIGNDFIPTMALFPDDQTDDESLSLFSLVRMKTNEAFSLPEGEILAGCSKDCDLVLEADEACTVSRRHCFILQKNGKIYARDVSTNGTYLGALGQKRNDFYRLPKDTLTRIMPFQIVAFSSEMFILVKNEQNRK